jgi:glycosyltransferase involved in cell wall biosynthesis
MPRKSLTIILPCYNPETNWHQNLLQQYESVCEHLHDFEIDLILVNDGSKTQITKEVEKLQQLIPNFTYIHNKINQGKGAAIRSGVYAAKGEYIIYTDIDFPYTSQSFNKITQALANFEISIGTRDNSYFHAIPKHRAFISKCLKFMIKTSLQLPTSDTQGGLKGMRASIKPLFLRTEINRYLFDLEFLFLATKEKKTISIQPIELRNETDVKKMNLRIVSKEISNFMKIFLKAKFT